MMFRGREYTQRKHYCIPNKPICWFSYPKTPCHPPRLNSILGLSVPVVLSLRHTALRCSFNSIRSNHVSSSSAYLITWCLSTEDMRHETLWYKWLITTHPCLISNPSHHQYNNCSSTQLNIWGLNTNHTRYQTDKYFRETTRFN